MTTSLLDELPGVGPARKRALIAHFGSPDGVVAASQRGAPGGAGAAGEGRRASCTPTCTAPAESRALCESVGAVRAPSGARRAHNARDGRDQAVRPCAPSCGAASKPIVESRLQDLVVITGFSGAGKSTAMNVFEDAGYFCVDNLPPEMIRSLVELFVHEGSKVERAAVVSDVRGGVYFEALQAVRRRSRRARADPPRAVPRRRRADAGQPLQGDAPAPSAGARTAASRPASPPSGRCWSRCASRADLVIDTTGMSAAMLRGKIADEFLPRQPAARLAVTFMSFGFKHGPPREEDLAFDVRFLPNPHYEPELRELTGLDPRVVEYIARDGRLERALRAAGRRCSTSCCRSTSPRASRTW